MSNPHTVCREAEISTHRSQTQWRGFERIRQSGNYFSGYCHEYRKADPTVRQLGVETAVVIGGGNIWRGLTATHIGEWTGRQRITWECLPL